MPELPEVETVRRGLVPVMEGATITRAEVRRKDLRFPFPDGFQERLTGRRIESLGRRAKYLLADLDGGEVVIMHLGMSGSFRIETAVQGDFHHARSRDAAHDHVVFHLSSGATVTYNDPRRFGFMLLSGRAALADHPLFAHLGVEPTGNALSAAYLAERFRDKQAPLKAALLDQSIIAGLGNIYVCEALFRAGLAPTRKAGSLVTKAGAATARLERLVPVIHAVIAEALEAGGSTLRDHAQPSGELGYFQHRFQIYDREGEACLTAGCRSTVRRMVQSNRSTFYCPTCQR
ncbi:bifunctional DNA-formamidopyrimidine glycosylase/DNA-(apurinic or apyrimidinic site) lyase [Phreatobacter sp. AB_2022a]|uniref:bifunctional DNA-formamidopyrimidine glycosylase/DNA-(apurinic or apyrimidinic site) lyase n=1 Tax=Phreatobacter sp. AB_2022a TaxID=3003134 RepID=UPI0022873423|nr:bifunctional DNA-formamidopyrimidine glycosylase/DNA-(apurinic or apyrimidinic site) lyase [Phreatobacter sp. AB_2022a]MCZ0737491.1 bifunctional DNA-formamidopyrimidine glycosylase/DNA-(apurinic or apyrimidinic site) lyase [Phreatobacter sp. AB_2022a]